jgi:hypothetical protein
VPLRCGPPCTPLTGLLVAWDPDLHPRGADGQFIEKGGSVKLYGPTDATTKSSTGWDVFRGESGKVERIIPDPDEPGNPTIRVKVTAPGRFEGRTLDVKPHNVEAFRQKGRIDDTAEERERRGMRGSADDDQELLWDDGMEIDLDIRECLQASLRARAHGPVVGRATKAWTAEERDKAAKRGAAMPGGRYPIKDKADVAKAVRAVGRGKGDHAKIRAHIKKRAKALGAMDLIPDTWK